MLITHEREKLIQAINYFSRNTKNCGKTKLFKLLYFLDFEHFKETGRSVTGMDYYAWAMGPVPTALFNEIKNPGEDLSNAFSFESRSTAKGEMLIITPKIEFSNKHFSKREIRIMSNLAKEYENSRAKEMIEETHLENLPWHKVYHEQGRPQAEIPYDLAIRADEMQLMKRIIEEREELIRTYK